MKWLRLWSEMLDDEAVQQLPLSAFKVWIDLLCVVGEADGAPVTPEQLAFRARARKNRVKTGIDLLISVGLVVTRNGRIKPRNWSRFQYESDSSTTRVKRFRKRSSNVAETPPDTETEQSRLTSSSSSSTKTPQKTRPRPLFPDARLACLAAQKSEQVARLVDLADSLGYERDGGKCAAVVKGMGHGVPVVELMVAGLSAKGDPWEYVLKVVSNAKANGRAGGGGRQGASREESGLAAGYEPATEDELAALARSDTARLAAGGSGGAGDDAELNTGAVQGQAGEPVQRPGDGGDNG